MKIRIISSREEINSIRPNEKAVHLAFRASNVDFLNLIQKAPRLQMVQVPTSYIKTMSNAIEVFLEMQGIELLQGDVWGHRKDLDEYFTVEDATIEEIQSLVASGASMDDVTDKIQRKTRLNPDLIKYVANNKITA
jgi:maleate cis-trans isomerase